MKHVLATLLVLGATPAAAHDFPVRLKDGATWTITAEHSRVAPGMGLADNWSLKTVKRLTWRAAGAGKAATIRIEPLSAVAGPDLPKEVAQGRSLAIPATLVVDEGLAPGEILNRDEVRSEFKRIAPGAANARDELIDASTKVMAAAELGAVSRVQGLSLNIGQTTSASVDMANPLGRQKLRGMETATLVSLDEASGKAMIHWRQALDPASFKAFVEALLEVSSKSKPPSGVSVDEVRAALAGAAYQDETECDVQVDTRSGLATRVECLTKQDVTTHGKTEHLDERWLITQTLPGAS